MTEHASTEHSGKDRLLKIGGIAAMAVVIMAAKITGGTPPMLFGIRAEFVLFGLTLLGVALLHHNTFEVAVTGLIAILTLKLLADPEFSVVHHAQEEAMILLNLLGLLLGFAVLARHFEQSEVPELLPNYLPSGVAGGFSLLAMVFVLSSFLDNIAAAMIGGTVAMHVFKGNVHIGYLAAVVAASNAGGSGSVVGDTTTTMMWIEGVNALDVTHAYFAAIPSLLVFGPVAAWQQNRLQPIQRDAPAGASVKVGRIAAVALMLALTIVTNVMLDLPAAGLWIAIIVAALFLKTDWQVIPASLKGSLFLIALVSCASMMPVEELPPASWPSAMGLGFVSSVFDNIPLTKLALDQGGYDWGVLAFAVGFGGSMTWFGSSAGVALTNIFPQAKNVGGWVTKGWHVTLAYVIGFAVMLLAAGWHPHAPIH
jgi:Na+/H+ antiporter NhaD/arsenite permease-like protein